MKKLFAILLCVFVLLQSGILTFQYVWKLAAHKRTIEASLEKGLFSNRLIRFSTLDLKSAEWENAHEFFLGSEKYDVVKKLRVNGEMIYSCINDKTEKSLIEGLAKSEKKSSLTDEIIKKINVQMFDPMKFEMHVYAAVLKEKFFFFLNGYRFEFSTLIIKPPIY